MNALFLLGFSSPVTAVLLMFGFHLLNLLLPIIPAVVIYRLFPEGTTGPGGQPVGPPHAGAAHAAVEGNIGGWKIKAVGAWAAYITAFLLGFWAINSLAVPLIKAVGGASVWRIDTDVKLMDEQGHEIHGAINNLVVKPPIAETWGKHASFTLWSSTLEPPEKLQIRLDGYDDETILLRGLTTDNGTIKLPLITLKRLPPPDESIPAPTPLPAGQGPPAVTSNP